MKILKLIGSIVGVLLIMILLAIYFLPSTAHMERSIYIDAPPHQVYLDLVSYRNFNLWSPWTSTDPEATYSIEGPAFGVGSKINWESHHAELGDGSTEIVETIEDTQVTSVLKFDEYNSIPYGTFLLEAEGNGCRVVWAYDEYNVTGLSKLFVLGIDGFLGRDWELALERLKVWVESAPRYDYEINFKEVKGFSYLGKEDTVLNDSALISTRMTQHFGDLMTVFSINRLEPAGHPIAIITGIDDETKSFICGIPIMSMFDSGQGYAVYNSYEGLVATSEYREGYSNLSGIHQRFREFIAYYGYELAGDPWEEYVPQGDLVNDNYTRYTIIYYPIR